MFKLLGTVQTIELGANKIHPDETQFNSVEAEKRLEYSMQNHLYFPGGSTFTYFVNKLEARVNGNNRGQNKRESFSIGGEEYSLSSLIDICNFFRDRNVVCCDSGLPDYDWLSHNSNEKYTLKHHHYCGGATAYSATLNMAVNHFMNEVNRTGKNLAPVFRRKGKQVSDLFIINWGDSGINITDKIGLYQKTGRLPFMFSIPVDAIDTFFSGIRFNDNRKSEFLKAYLNIGFGLLLDLAKSEHHNELHGVVARKGINLLHVNSSYVSATPLKGEINKMLESIGSVRRRSEYDTSISAALVNMASKYN
ncbi:MAG: hypothetical protein WCJ19_02260 [bacterium]